MTVLQEVNFKFGSTRSTKSVELFFANLLPYRKSEGIV